MLPHKLKEMCRIKISVAHQCGYCSTVRSNVAKAEGLTEDMIDDLADFASSGKNFTAREKAALHYADLFKQGEHAIDKDEVYQELQKHFSDEEIIELGLLCAQTDGVGKLVKSLNVLSWEDACELNPKLSARRKSQRLPNSDYIWLRMIRRVEARGISFVNRPVSLPDAIPPV